MSSLEIHSVTDDAVDMHLILCGTPLCGDRLSPHVQDVVSWSSIIRILIVFA